MFREWRRFSVSSTRRMRPISARRTGLSTATAEAARIWPAQHRNDSGVQRVLVTSHDAFRYFGRAYGLEVEGIRGSPPSPRRDCSESTVWSICWSIARSKRVCGKQCATQECRRAGRWRAGPRPSDPHRRRAVFGCHGIGWNLRRTYEGMLDHNITLVTRSLGGQAIRKD